LSLSQSDPEDVPWLDESVASTLHSIAASLGEAGATVDLIVVDDVFIRRINRDYRGKDRPTNVISFSYLDEEATGGRSVEDDPVGEIYVSRQTLEREAASQGVEPQFLFLRLAVHGLLHVLGFDHENEVEAKRMEDEERRLLLGHVDVAEVERLF